MTPYQRLATTCLDRMERAVRRGDDGGALAALRQLESDSNVVNMLQFDGLLPLDQALKHIGTARELLATGAPEDVAMAAAYIFELNEPEERHDDGYPTYEA